jgi:helicase
VKRIDAGTKGAQTCPLVDVRDIGLAEDWESIVRKCVGDRPLRPVQANALATARMLDTRRHLLVCAPTNSGKSVVGYLAMIEAIRGGRRAVLLEPLRALAQEKAEELSELFGLLEGEIGGAPDVQLSTGDYRLENEGFEDAPPEFGEVIIATPERLEAIMRNPDNESWVESLGAVVVDEAHLVGNANRGPTLELLIATLLASERPPRLVLLSATIGEPERLRDWLRPCDLIEEDTRVPQLHLEVLDLSDDEDADSVLMNEVSLCLEQESTSVLIFVYRRNSTVSLAQPLSKSLSQPALAYHSGMSTSRRKSIRYDYLTGSCRCIVTTTALAMGMNLPATHVFVRDTTFFGFGQLGLGELTQIVGRAGRGDRNGTAAILVRPNDEWNASTLAEALRINDLPPIRSSFHTLSSDARNEHTITSEEEASAQIVASCLSRVGADGLSSEEMQEVLSNTLAGPKLAERAEPALRWLEDPNRLLGYLDDDERHHLTALGQRGVRAVLPLSYVSGLGQLLRDLLWIDSKGGMLSEWSQLDDLIVMCLLSDRFKTGRRFSEKLAEQIDGWHEAAPQKDKSLLFRKWIAGSAEASKADELLGSLGLTGPSNPTNSSATSRKTAYLAALNAVVIMERSRGAAIKEIERRWGISNLEGTDEPLRDTALWLLAGQAKIFDLRCFYYHLVENCEASTERVLETKKQLTTMKFQLYDLIEQLKYCSPLGPLVLGVRNMLKGHKGPSLGAGTLRRLEDSGATSIADIAEMSLQDLIDHGLQKRYAKQIKAYLRRRLR